MNLTIQSYDCNSNNKKISFQRLDNRIPKLIKSCGKDEIDMFVKDCTERGVEVLENDIYPIIDTANEAYKNIYNFVKKIHNDIVFKRIKNKDGQNTFVLTHKNGEPITFKNYSGEPSGFECTSTAEEIELKQYHTIYHTADVTPDKPKLQELYKFTTDLKGIDPKLIHEAILESMIDKAYRMVITNSSPEALNEQLNAIYKFAKETGLEKGLKKQVDFALKVANEHREPVKDIKIDPELAKRNKDIAKKFTDTWQIGKIPEMYWLKSMESLFHLLNTY